MLGSMEGDGAYVATCLHGGAKGKESSAFITLLKHTFCFAYRSTLFQSLVLASVGMSCSININVCFEKNYVYYSVFISV